eukprot:TRINITY_DN4943_c0_g1_i1.p1 TRINITY_DN4943_c0_g1~~TRINITY_DN4943_c0_g1_i1.p1  ORF type:complete len:360 (+),score=69.30 TRINITY_DN4943_c0_g1_i1:102-1082(+)
MFGFVFRILFWFVGLYQKIARYFLEKSPFLERYFDIFACTLADCARLLTGNLVAKGPLVKPEQPLVLYEFEGCPFCRKVRETICVLDLDVVIYPCPRETVKAYGVCRESRYRPDVKRRGGQLQFPFLIDPNSPGPANQGLYESSEIIAYLWKTYGKGCTPPLNYRIKHSKLLQPVVLIIEMLISMFLRPLPSHGGLRVPSNPAAQPLELWGREGSPFVAMVREALCSLELPYRYKTVALGSQAKRREFHLLFGKDIPKWRQNAKLVMVPLLLDPNTGRQMFESRDIVNYLRETYQTGAAPYETLADYSSKGAGKGHGTMPGATKQD